MYIKNLAAVVAFIVLLLFMAACNDNVITTAITDTPRPPTLTSTMPKPSPVPRATSTPTELPFAKACTGRKLLILGRRPNDAHGHYYVVCEDGGVLRRFPDDLGRSPAVSPQGDLIAFTSPTGNIAITDLNGILKKKIIVLGEAWSPTWSPDGQYIAYVRSGISVEAIHVETGAKSTSLIPATFEYPKVSGMGEGPKFTEVAWSPQKASIAVNTNYETPYLVDIGCDSTTHLCSPKHMTRVNFLAGGKLTWSPDGTRFAVVCYSSDAQSDSLCLINTSGNVTRSFSNLSSDTGSQFVLDPAWSPDGKTIAVEVGDQVLLLSVDSGDAFDLTGHSDVYPDVPSDHTWLP